MKRWTLIALVAMIVGVGIWWRFMPEFATHSKRIPTMIEPEVTSQGREPVAPWFREVAKEVGIDFRYRNGEDANHYTILESLGGGVALFDFDNDGLLDVFLVGGGTFVAGEPFTVQALPNRLYRNLGNWKFVDVTASVGLDEARFYGHGAAACDYDRDGFTDLLVTGYAGWTLYHNEAGANGSRRFVNVTERAGLPVPRWATSAAWGDLDGDGWPDLYVCQYVDWTPAKNLRCPSLTSPDGRDVCPPQQFEPLPDFLFRNRGDGTFEDRTVQAKIRGDGKGLGVLLCDVNDDGRPDIYVANDATDNFLYLNRGGWKFDEVGFAAGVARDEQGKYDGSMGVDAADIDGSGRPSLLVTNFQDEWHALYRNLGKERFAFASQPFGFAALGQHFVGFGVTFTDFDRDGLEDVMIANGHVLRYPRVGGMSQKTGLMRGVESNGRRRFERIEAGDYFAESHIGRGLATGDLDNDGCVDVVISHQNAPVAVLRNITPVEKRGWIGIDPQIPDHRSMVGAKLRSVGPSSQFRFAKGGGSYLSSSDPRWVIGVSGTGKVDMLEIQLPWQNGLNRFAFWEGTYRRMPIKLGKD